jgi:ribosomal protein S17
MDSAQTEKSLSKVRDGKVVSNKMDKTVVVAITPIGMRLMVSSCAQDTVLCP